MEMSDFFRVFELRNRRTGWASLTCRRIPVNGIETRVDDRRLLTRDRPCPEEVAGAGPTVRVTVYGPKKGGSTTALYAGRSVRHLVNGYSGALAGYVREDASTIRCPFIDSTCIKVEHRCAGGGKGGPWPMASAAPRGAATTKLHAVCDAKGRPLVLLLKHPGNVRGDTARSCPALYRSHAARHRRTRRRQGLMTAGDPARLARQNGGTTCRSSAHRGQEPQGPIPLCSMTVLETGFSDQHRGERMFCRLKDLATVSSPRRFDRNMSSKT